MNLKSDTDNLKIIFCDECESKFHRASSKMSSLCPECASALYGCENCQHEFSDGRCLKCYWDGSTSAYIKKLKLEES